MCDRGLNLSFRVSSSLVCYRPGGHQWGLSFDKDHRVIRSRAGNTLKAAGDKAVDQVVAVIVTWLLAPKTVWGVRFNFQPSTALFMQLPWCTR